jgi:hypothetical protein
MDAKSGDLAALQISIAFSQYCLPKLGFADVMLCGEP